MQQIELLAPAKNLELGKIAIDCGADALYIGAPKFSARKAVGNSISDIASLVKYAHFYNVKIYVALNTILTDTEITEAEKLIWQLNEIKIDGLIIQDMGLLELKLPPIPIIASTQCDNRTVEKVKFLEDVGISRVILARELSISQIKEIKDKTNIELETFIHGALCVGYSGKCYMSYASTDRSGNRGECSQPCRHKYTLTDSKNQTIIRDKYLLSLKDFNASGHLQDLLDAGVTSFKIEGRLKDEDYIRNVVSHYRKLLDDLIDKNSLTRASKGNTSSPIKTDLRKTFNRRYSSYFLNERGDNIISPDSPKFIGEYIGEISTNKRNFFSIRSDKVLNNGDGITFFDQSGELCGTKINRVDGYKIYPLSMKGIRVGIKVYRNFGHQFNKDLLSAKIKRTIGIDILFADIEDGFELTVSDGENNVKKQIKIEKEYAKNPVKSKEIIERQLCKLGDSKFHLNTFSLNTKKDYFIPISELNELRRKTLKILVKLILESYERLQSDFKPNKTPYFEEEIGYDANVINSKAQDFYKRHGVKKIEDGLENRNVPKGTTIMTTKHCLKYECGLCKKYPKDSLFKVSKNKSFKEPFYLSDRKDSYEVKFDCEKCEMLISKI